MISLDSIGVVRRLLVEGAPRRRLSLDAEALQSKPPLYLAKIKGRPTIVLPCASQAA